MRHALLAVARLFGRLGRIGTMAAIALALIAIAGTLALAAPVFRGILTIRADPGQTTANTKIFKVQNAAGTDKATADIEGDVVCNDLAPAGALTVTGASALNGGVSVDSPAWSVADTTGAMTTTGLASLNGGIAVDSALTIADSTGAIATTGLVSANGGIAVDTSAFTVADSTGNTVIAGSLAANGGISCDTSAFTVADSTGNVHTAGTLDAAGAITGPVTIVSASTGTTVLTAVQSGAVVANTGTSGTTAFTLPDAAAGLHYCFVEAGDAAGELLVGVQAGDLIIGRGMTDTNGTGGSTAITTSAGTGIKNTAATNVKGDFSCVTALDGTTWVMTSVTGIWASQ